jgi:hypothetical protein
VNAPSVQDIRLELEKASYDVLHPEGIEFARRGFKFETKQHEIWARVHVQLGKTDTLELGVDEPLGTRGGFLIIQVFILPNTDVGTGERICSLLESGFRYKYFGGAHCEEPYTEEVGLDSDGAWYQFNVTVPFWAWVGK